MEITIPLNGHSKVNPKEYQPAVGGHSIGDRARMVLNICPSGYECCYNGIEAHFSWRTLHKESQHMATTATWLAGLHTLSVTHKDYPPPPPVPSDRPGEEQASSSGVLQTCNGSTQDVEFGRGRVLPIRIDTSYRSGTRCRKPLYMLVINLMAGFQREERKFLRDT